MADESWSLEMGETRDVETEERCCVINSLSRSSSPQRMSLGSSREQRGESKKRRGSY